VLVDALGLSSFEPAPQFGRALQDFLTQPTGNSHAELWRYCAFDVDLLRQRMGKVWESFETYNVARASEPSVQAAVARLMDEFGLHAIAPDELAKIEVPATLIWGRHDLATSLSVAESASRRFGWPLHVIENCADDPPVEQPKALAQALLAAIGH
jgi:pimeloyl-ACP methyl ester carboxylesterase